MNRLLFFYCFLGWGLLVFSGAHAAAGPQRQPICLTDTLNRNITIDAPLERVVTVNTAVAIILRAMGVDIQNKIVGVTRYVNQNPKFWPELVGKPGIHFTNPSYEILAELNPEVVFFYRTSPMYTNEKMLKALGIKAVYLDCFDPRTMDRDILFLGRAFGRERQAKALLDWCKGWESKVAGRIAGIPQEARARVFYYIYPDANMPKGIYRTCNRRDSTHGLVETSGGISISAGLPLDRTTVSPEWIMEQDPDVIIAGVIGKDFSGYNADPEKSAQNLENMRQRLINDRALSRTRAAKNRRVLVHAQDLKQGPAYVLGLISIAKFLYPDRFADIHPRSVIKEYYEKWCGLPARGVFVRPPPEPGPEVSFADEKGDSGPLLVTDSIGRTSEVPVPVRRVACLHTSACREFCLLGVEDRVVGVTDYLKKLSGLYPRLADKPVIGSVYTPAYEVILEQNPDLLVMSTARVNLDPVVSKLVPQGIPVVALDLQPNHGKTVDEREAFYDRELASLGRMLGRTERAEAFIQWKNQIIDLIRERTKGGEKRRVLGINLSGTRQARKNYHIWAGTRIIELSGSLNAAAGVRGETVSPEWILEQDPDAIILASYHENDGMGYGAKRIDQARETLETVRKDRVFGRTRAARENQIYLFGYYGLGSGGQTPLGALCLAKRLYPARFSDLDPEKLLRDYYENWFNMPYQGLWFYP